MKFFTTTGPGAFVREFVFVTIPAPGTVAGSQRPHPQAGQVAVQGFFERVGREHPEVRFARAFRGVQF